MSLQRDLMLKALKAAGKKGITTDELLKFSCGEHARKVINVQIFNLKKAGTRIRTERYDRRKARYFLESA